jgi:membrane protein implicated in regulation of membrane protease activity
MALILTIAEMLSLSFVLLCFALGAGVTAFVAYTEAAVTWQLLAFAITCVLAMLFLRPVFSRILYRKSEDVPVNTEGMLGIMGVVVESNGHGLAAGRVKLRGEEWRALSEDDAVLEEGQNVTVVGVSGATIRVRAI